MWDDYTPRFLLQLLTVYGFLQGAGTQLFSMAFFYYWKDIVALPPDGLQRYEVLASMPWDFKPLWGFLSDVFPPKSFYLTAGACAGCLYMTLLCRMSSVGAGESHFAMLATFMQANAALSLLDVMMDGMIVEEVRDKTDKTAIYAAGTMAHFVCAAFGGLTKGAVQDEYGCQGQFAIVAAILAVVACVSLAPPFSALQRSRKGRLFAQRSAPRKAAPAPTRSPVASCRCLLRAMQLPCIYKPLLYQFLIGATCPSFGGAYFYFLTDKGSSPLRGVTAHASHHADDLGQHIANGSPTFWHLGSENKPTSATADPGFSPEWLGFMSVVGSVVSVFGVLLYRNYLYRWQFRSVFTLCHIFQVGFSVLDLVIVLRLNVTVLGIPDKIFALCADDVMHPLISRIWGVPFQIFTAAALCPPGLEATMFAMLAAVGHIGKDMGKWLGAEILGMVGVSKADFSMLWLCIVIRSFLKLLAIGFVWLLIPDATPASVSLPPEVSRAAEMDSDSL